MGVCLDFLVGVGVVGGGVGLARLSRASLPGCSGDCVPWRTVLGREAGACGVVGEVGEQVGVEGSALRIHVHLYPVKRSVGHLAP